MREFEEFHDPRLAVLYDLWGMNRADTAFYESLAAELGAVTIVDIGCGTGEITCQLARRGHRVTGIDPAAAMLEIARKRPGGHLVRWLDGEASSFDGPPRDLAILTGHTAQVIHHQQQWAEALAAVHDLLAPGGHLAFESRNPAAYGWRAWTPGQSHQRWEQTPLGPVDVWTEVTDIQGDVVHTRLHYHLESTGEELTSNNVLRFRSQAELTEGLLRAGFSVQHVHGDWDRTPVTAGSPELIFVATRP